MKNKFSLSLTIALVLALVAATWALADNLLSDNDGLTPVVDTPSLALGNVCTGTTTTKPIAHAISRGSGGGNTYANNSTVVVSIINASGTGLSASGGGNITLPSNWGSQVDGTKSNSVTTSIVFVAGGVPRSFSGTVDYKAVGPRSTSGTLTQNDSLTVTATVINCDITPPTLNLPANMTVEATGLSGAAVTFTATADDANPSHPAVTCAPASGSTFGFGTTTVNCSAKDAANNTANGSFTVTVSDTTPPTVTPPSNISVEALDGSGAVVTYGSASASDIVDGALTPICSPASGSTFPLGVNTVTCSATDSHGNTGSAGFTIDVKDTTAPALSLPTDITKEATGASGAAVDFTFSASDSVDGAVAITCDANSGATFPLGTTKVSCSATDKNGNTNGGSFNVNVVDTTAPELTLPASFSVEATDPSGATATFSATASDLVDGSVAVACTPASGSTFPLGESTVNCSATDAHSNTANGSFNLTVVDTTAPDLILPADQQLEATSPAGAQAFFTPTATDLVNGALAVSCSANSGDTFQLGTTTVSCSVSDAAGNEASGSFVIIVKDTTAPTIIFVDRTPANSNGWNNGDVTVNWSCSDIVGVKAASVNETVSTEGAHQSATGTCEDTSGNKASDTQTGINIDKTAPSASASRTPDANSFGWNNTDVTVSFSGADGLSGLASCSDNQTFGEGADQSASGTCTDKAGNVSEAAMVENINVDKTAPTISGAPDRDANTNGWYKDDVTVTFTCNDARSGVAKCTPASTLGEGAGQSVPGSVTDKAGNTASTAVTGINIDKTAPIITASMQPPSPNDWYNIATGAPTVTFTCDDVLSGVDGACPASHTFDDGENQSYSQTIYDLAGNSASDGVSGVNVDTVAPSISASVSPARPASGWWNIASGAPTVSFDCGDATSGVVTCPASNTFGEGENQVYSATVYDQAGNFASDDVNNIDVDLTAPAVTVTPERGADYNGWYNAPVFFSFSATDDTSDVNDCDSNVSFTGPDSATANVNGSCSDNAGNSDSASITFKYDNTDPSISATVSPDRSMSGWWNISTGAPTVNFICNDATADVESCQGPHTFGNGENQGFTGHVIDNAGNTNSASVSNIDVDLIAPSISADLDRSPAASGWFNASTGEPKVQFTCSDSGSSDLVSCPANYLFGQGADQSYSETVYDHAGNSASAGVSGVNVDTVAPSISASVSPARPASGWWNIASGAPTVTYTCSDATSLIASCTAPYLFLEDVNQGHTGTAMDNAGNTASTEVSDIDVDLTAPTLTWDPGVYANGASFYFGFVPAWPPNPCVTNDVLSGPHPDGCAMTGYATTVGSHTLTATGYDNAGNSKVETRTYTVMAWTLKGFYQPVDMGGVYNVVKNGSTVPLKFEIFAGGTELTDVSAVKSLTYAQTTCSATATTDEIETVATGGTVLRYDSTSGQFIFNWKTPATAGKCYRVTMTTQDGSTLVAFFKLK